MFKSLLIGINLIGFLLFNFYFQSGLTVEQTLPASLNPGESREISVTIKKPGITGFAKYQLDVSEGLIVSVIEGSGSSFTFNNQTGKFIWMSLPDSRSFTFKYKIQATESAAGVLTVDSRFSYIYENERKNYDLPQAAIAIAGSETPEITEPEIAKDTATAILNNNAMASANRIITPLGNDSYRVDISLSKENLTGFAKVEEVIPADYTAVNVNGRSSVFSLDNQHVKFIWFDIPEEESLTISYKLLATTSNPAEEPRISGEFSFPKGDFTEVINIGGMIMPQIETVDMQILADIDETTDSIAVEEEAPIDAEEVTVEPRDKSMTITPDIEVIETEEAPEEIIADVPKTEEQPSEEEEKEEVASESATRVLSKGRTDGNIANVPEPEEGISYRVQVAAGKNNLSKEQFSKMYFFGEGLKLENHKGWFKYTTGYYPVYKEARDDRERITKQYEKFKGPFVTAYNDGDRITVQEALMVTNQKWYP